MKNKIFEVDIQGLRTLQEGKPKWVIIRELLQNAIDEDITQCDISLSYSHGKATVRVEDDSPQGFRDLADTYTLFKDTYKREDVKKRGRFNFGEKQVLCLADYAQIVSTCGGFEFNVLKGTKTVLRTKREKGSVVVVIVRMSKDEFCECVDYCKSILIPTNVNLNVNNIRIPYIKPLQTFKARLLTEVKEDGRMRGVTRETDVDLHPVRAGVAYLYEMGIPVCVIDCDYSIDIQQKVPLSTDRDKVDNKYLKVVYGEVLNHVVDDIVPSQSSNLWIRTGFTSDRASMETRTGIIKKRFGEKAVIANPNDRNSLDEAISRNYNLVWGSEMSGDEWDAVKQGNLMKSSTAMFGATLVNGTIVTPTPDQHRIAVFCKKIAKEVLNLNINVSFLKAPKANTVADYSSESNLLRFNVSKVLDWTLENGYIRKELLNLIIHELGHSAGFHYEQSYHECLTKLGSRLTLLALNNPKWFKLY